jgi:transglutaminase-like putative cysteine protease
MAGAVRYRVRHANIYRYGHEIAVAHHLVHLSPRAAPGQRVLAFRMNVDPAPGILVDHPDVFGNQATFFEMREPHVRLAIETEIDIEVTEPAPLEADPPWERLRDRLARPGNEEERSAAAFAFPSPKVGTSAELLDFAMPSFKAGRGIAEAVLDLTERIYRGFTFDSTATTISTPVADVLANRRGVCQDFAHLAIGCLRSLGLAARYVSGYLRTIPPPGRPRAIGGDASHAWLSVWCGDGTWRNFDPTNGRPGSTDLITLAWGRDYGDVSPTRGVILGSNIQHLTVSVDVEAQDPRAQPD